MIKIQVCIPGLMWTKNTKHLGVEVKVVANFSALKTARPRINQTPIQKTKKFQT